MLSQGRLLGRRLHGRGRVAFPMRRLAAVAAERAAFSTVLLVSCRIDIVCTGLVGLTTFHPCYSNRQTQNPDSSSNSCRSGRRLICRCRTESGSLCHSMRRSCRSSPICCSRLQGGCPCRFGRSCRRIGRRARPSEPCHQARVRHLQACRAGRREGKREWMC